MNAIMKEARPTAWQEKLEWGLTSFYPIELKYLFGPLSQYLALLQKWNQTYNLTAIRDPLEMVSAHLLDSLAVVPHLPGTTLLDVGTGPGLPGIPLALAFPERKFTLLDSIDKKTTFLRQAVAELGLKNVTVVCERVERWHPASPFECIISRAYAELSTFVDSSAHLLAPNGTYVAMKGRYPADEIERLGARAKVKNTIQLQVPGLDAERHLIIMEPA